ncbi:MAG TPA: tRNA (adenosine(37)-N6)-threonylcarbamoyltransferase complex ATPase subunit type 1 TsaE [Candidatus Saccharimonadales bacterium]|nr:tRNA (adenosine(37)-N6)-threonylcarbamoyltransferase complex ATPase subunit type 1 TsaE [Candidatus Saccharimonadales bacterium]
MNTDMTLKIVTSSSAETERLAGQIGRRLRGGETIELISDLGGGKTTFVRGLARGFGSKDKVTSPSFTLSNEYKADDKTLFHFDFYRLQEPGIMSDELAEAVGDPKTVTVVEWADIVQKVLPDNRLTINIKATDEDLREFTLEYPENLKYLIPENT